MAFLLMAAVALLSFANGANDNFKEMATLWGAGRTSYRRSLAWATGFTLLGSLVAVWAASGLAAKFNGSKLLAHAIYTPRRFSLLGIRRLFVGAFAKAAAKPA